MRRASSGCIYAMASSMASACSMRPQPARCATSGYTGERFDLGLGWFRPSNARDADPPFVEHLGGGAGFFNVIRIYPIPWRRHRGHGERDEVRHRRGSRAGATRQARLGSLSITGRVHAESKPSGTLGGARGSRTPTFTLYVQSNLPDTHRSTIKLRHATPPPTSGEAKEGNIRMDVARKAFVGLAWSFVLAVAIQFPLAASASRRRKLGGTSAMGLHRPPPDTDPDVHRGHRRPAWDGPSSA